MKIYFLWLVFCLVFSGSLAAQTRNLQVVDPKRESPRATLTTFTNAFKQPRVGVSPDPIDDAVKCLDLQSIPADYRPLKGLELASQLLEIIDTVENFHVEDAPDSISGDPFLIYRSPVGEVVIAKQPSGEWLFTQETVRSVSLIMVGIDEEKTNLGAATLTHSESAGSQIRDRMPDILKQRTLMLERWQWLGIFALLIIAALVGLLVKAVTARIFAKIMRRRFNLLTDEDLRVLNAPIGLLAFVVVFRLGLRALALTQSSLGFLRTTMFLLTAFAIVWLAYKIVNTVAARLQKRALETESQADDLLVPFLSLIIRIVIVMVGVIVVAENLNFNVTGLVAGLGIGGIAIALASQETLSNFFGSLVLMVERPFMADDLVTVGGIHGTVKEVGIRSTLIQTFDNSVVTVPNSSIVKANIVNDGFQRYRSWVVKLNVPYQNGAEKLEEFCRGIEEIIKGSEHLNNQTYNLHIFDVVLPSVIIRAEINFKEDNLAFEMDARQQFIMDVLRLADTLGIELKAK